MVLTEVMGLCRVRRKKSELDREARRPGRELEFYPTEEGETVKSWLGL